jgi:hypothetical protein
VVTRISAYQNSEGYQLKTLKAKNSVTGDQTTTWVYGTTLSDSDVARNDLVRVQGVSGQVRRQRSRHRWPQRYPAGPHPSVPAALDLNLSPSGLGLDGLATAHGFAGVLGLSVAKLFGLYLVSQQSATFCNKVQQVPGSK